MNLKMTSVKVVSDGECTDPKVAAWGLIIQNVIQNCRQTEQRPVVTLLFL
jgi:hypothetical protein